MKQIQGISVEGVRYIGESGDPGFIDFRECNHNWIQYRSRTKNLKDDEIQNICQECDMVYQPDNIIKEIEDQLFLVDTSIIGNSINFKELMILPRLLKKNYFDFSS
ncbi:YokU family protein [Bacillus sp. 1NLA3E]|uniref:YokU family protein n=1 Tax=Bacillus sp. 1NLA3E TaxID=666686 RepID=UPI000247F497|nr:YokU family protein [Bacillus sp. 1NLA3E]AGK54517.1 hypothetical protein B1NLA3E_13845 [Bacillus sp. 1NLA3E]